MSRRPIATSAISPELIETYAISDRMNQIVLDCIDPAVWRAKPPGSKTRTIAAIFSHMHNVRRKWIRLSASHVKLPTTLNGRTCTQQQVKDALAESAIACGEMLTTVKIFHRDGWAQPWSAGAAMAGYMIAHDAHHRGQICMLAHQLGFPLPTKCDYGIWAWEKLSKESGFSRLR